MLRTNKQQTATGQQWSTQLEAVRVTFGHLAVLTNVDFVAPPTGLVTVTGKSGSGKSTLLNLISGTLQPSAGTVVTAGRRMGSARERAAAQRSSIGYVFQSAQLINWMTALENVMMGLRYTSVAGKRQRDLAVQALKSVGLAQRAGHKPGELSGGERQRVSLARALVRQPMLLLADEPTGNLDSETGAEIISQIVKASLGAAVVLVTHDPALANRGTEKWSVQDGTVRRVL